MRTNIFKIIIGTEKEDYHDRILEWLGHPRESHGLGSALFHALVRRLFDESTDEPVLRIKREYPLSKEDWGDLFLESASYAIVIDDKVSVSAIHDDKVESYLRLTAERFHHKKYVSALLSPRAIPPERFAHQDQAHLRIMLWSEMAMIIRSLARSVQGEFERELLRQYVEYITERLAVPEGAVAPPGRRSLKEGAWTASAFFHAIREMGGQEAEQFHRRLYETARRARFGTIVFGRGRHPSWLLKIGRGQRQVSLLGAQADGRVWMDFSGWGEGLKDRTQALFRRDSGGAIADEARWTFLDRRDRGFLLNLESLLQEAQQLA